MFTRIVSVIVLLTFTIASVGCTSKYMLPREQFTSHRTFVSEVTLDSGQTVRFAPPGAIFVLRLNAIHGRTEEGQDFYADFRSIRTAVVADYDGARLTERQVGRNGLERLCSRLPDERILRAVYPSGEMIEFEEPGALMTGPPWVLSGFSGGSSREIPLEELSYIQVERVNSGKTVLAILGVTAVAAGISLALFFALKESCPFVYGFDGERYVLDAEPLGGAICKGLERTDLARLDHLRPVRGEYRLALRNEVEETQQLDRCDLLLVDHAAGCEVVPDLAARLYRVSGAVPPAEVTDEIGRDVTRFFAAEDAIAWQTHMAALAEGPPQGDGREPGSRPAPTRHTLTFRFARPEGVERAYLVVNAGATPWGSNMIREMLALRGAQLAEWYAEVDAGGPALARMQGFLAREELYHLKIHLQSAIGWEQQGHIFSGGPWVHETRALPIDLSRVDGDSLVIRLDPPCGFWGIDRVNLAWDVAPAPEPVAIAAHLALEGVDVALPGNGSAGAAPDIVSSLAEADGRYHVMPEVGDAFTLCFPAPDVAPGLERTIFLRATGYYQIHLPDDLPDRTPELAAIGATPGGITHYALDLFRKWQAEIERTFAQE